MLIKNVQRRDSTVTWNRDYGSSLAPLGAGLIAGSSSVIVGHPFDTIKTQLQVGKNLGTGLQIKNFGKQLRLLYRGVLPPLLAVGFVQSLNFSTFETAKHKLLYDSRRLEIKKDVMISKFKYLSTVFISGSIGGFVISSITIPISVLKVQQQLVTNKGLFSCAKYLVDKYSLKALYRGGVPGLVMEILGRAVYITTYETVKLMQLTKKEQKFIISGGVLDTTLRNKVIAAAIAGTIGWSSIYALDVTKSLMIVDIEGKKYPTWRSCIAETYKQGGIKRFYRGLTHALIRAAPVAATVLPIYETSKNFLIDIL